MSIAQESLVDLNTMPAFTHVHLEGRSRWFLLRFGTIQCHLPVLPCRCPLHAIDSASSAACAIHVARRTLGDQPPLRWLAVRWYRLP